MKKLKTGLIYLYLNFFLVSFAQLDENRNILPDWALGGFVRPAGIGTIINPDAASTFFCPMNQIQVKWEESDTFNPAAIVKDGEIVVLYRAEDNSATGIGKRVSRIGLASSSNGIDMVKRATPVLYPAEDNNKQYEWPGGCEDPRVAVTEDGTYVIIYTAYNRSVARLCVATSKDLVTWTKHGPAFAQAYNGKYLNSWTKSASIVTKVVNDKLVISKVNGKYFMYWGENKICAATSDDLVNWAPVEDASGNLLVLARTRKGYFDSEFVECGPPAVITDKGILLLYNGKNKTNADRDIRFNAGTYSAGQMLFDLNDPLKMIKRLDVPFFRPMESYEKSGQYTNGTVFIEGLVYFKQKWYLYYGCADSKVGVAVYDPSKVTDGDSIPSYPRGNGIGYYPVKGIGKKNVSIHSSSGQANANESAFNLLYTNNDPLKKWCDNITLKPWVIFELNDYYNIEKIVYRDVAPYENGNGNVPEYWIYYSTTGVKDSDWKLAVHKTNQQTVNVKEDVFDTPFEARYIKFIATRGIRTDTGVAENAIRLYGFDIYGTFLRSVDRNNIVSVGKKVLGFNDAKNYYEQPLHLLDGNLTNSANRWNFDKPATTDSLRYVVFDLEEEYDIEKFSLYDAGNFESNVNNLSGYSIYTSTQIPNFNLISGTEDNNTVWTKVVDATNRKLDNVKTDLIQPVKARYVKLEIPRSRTSNYTRLYEFEVYKKSIQNAINLVNERKLRIWPTIIKRGESINVDIEEPGELIVFSQQGALLLTARLFGSTNSYSINLPVGCYIVSVKTKSSQKNAKLLIA
jgi:predicted GH43/DUF377 family glycosyl hydrolase